jgi:hypothetical protein
MSRQSSFGQALLNGKLKLTQWTMAGTLLGKSRPCIVAWPSHNRRLGFGHDCLNHPLTQYCYLLAIILPVPMEPLAILGLVWPSNLTLTRPYNCRDLINQ